MPVNDNTVIIHDARIMFRNFAGREANFNSAGDRNFCIFLDPQRTEELKNAGWNVKFLKQREEEDAPQAYIQVAVNYKKGRPPRCVMITSQKRVDLGADEVELLDAAEIKKADVILNGYNWDVNGNKGVKAYLKTIFVTIAEDQLELEYAGVGADQETEADIDDPPF